MSAKCYSETAAVTNIEDCRSGCESTSLGTNMTHRPPAIEITPSDDTATSEKEVVVLEADGNMTSASEMTADGHEGKEDGGCASCMTSTAAVVPYVDSPPSYSVFVVSPTEASNSKSATAITTSSPTCGGCRGCHAKKNRTAAAAIQAVILLDFIRCLFLYCFILNVNILYYLFSLYDVQTHIILAFFVALSVYVLIVQTNVAK